jgi:DNA invertase Pin-like site-specific DNA recombinase
VPPVAIDFRPSHFDLCHATSGEAVRHDPATLRRSATPGRREPTAELLAIEADLSKRGVGLVVLSMGGERLDTRNPTSKLMLTILAGVATWEREIMLERQREGIAKAKSEGKYKGRPASIDAAEIRRLTATMGPAAIAKQLGVARSTVYRLLGQTATSTTH